MKVYKPQLTVNDEQWRVDFKESIDLPPSIKGVGLCLGFFDGVHQGHRELLRRLVYLCRKLQLSPDVWTFDTLPKFNQADSAVAGGFLQTEKQRLQELEAVGVARLFVQKFTPELAAMNGADFFNKVLLANLPVKLLVVGYDFRFGHKMEYGVEKLRKLAEANNIRLEVVEPVRLLQTAVHSTAIRQAVIAGDMARVFDLNGRDFVIRGVVVSGNAIGRTLGFATANIAIDSKMVLPPNGVYRSWIWVDNRAYQAISFIGKRPAIKEENKQLLLETHLLDVNMDLYGKEVEVALGDFMRPELDFPDLSSLQNQIQADITKLRSSLPSANGLRSVADYGHIKAHLLPIQNFNMGYARLTLRLPLGRDASAYNVALNYLTKTTAEYRQPIELNLALKCLYGADLFANSHKIGDILELQINVAALQKVPTVESAANPLIAVLNMAFNCLLEPNLDENGQWHEDLWQQEKQNLLDEWHSRQSNKATWLWNQSMGLAFPDTSYSLSTLGDIDYLRDLTLVQTKKAYAHLLAAAEIDLYIAADYDIELQKAIKNNLDRLAVQTAERSREAVGKIVAGSLPNPAPLMQKVSKVFHKPVEQSRIEVILATQLPYVSLKAVAVNLLNVILGGDSSSILFEIVREQHGLAYEIYSVNLPYRSGIAILAGVHDDKAVKAIDLIKFTLEDLQKNGVKDRDLRRAKTVLLADIRLLADKPAGLLEYYINQQNLGWNLRPDVYAQVIEDITLDEMQAVIADLLWQIDTILQSPENKVSTESVRQSEVVKLGVEQDE